MAFAGTLTGRIIDEKGNSLANTEIEIVKEGIKFRTNAFGAYSVNIKDGRRQLEIKIGKEIYLSDEIIIYSPTTEQNWRIDSKNKKLVRIR
jgi:hypothetical protein